jgi:hypothetical protein
MLGLGGLPAGGLLPVLQALLLHGMFLRQLLRLLLVPLLHLLPPRIIGLSSVQPLVFLLLPLLNSLPLLVLIRA